MQLIRKLALLLLLPSVAMGQTQHDRIKSRGASTFDEFSNTNVVIITGATPTVSAGNIFKTNNGGPTTVTNFLGGVDSQQITIICGDANTTISNNSNIVTSNASPFTCGTNQSISFIFVSSQGQWIQSGSVNGGGGGGSPGSPANSLQKNGGSNNFIASSVSDNGTTVKVGNEAQFCGANPYIDIRCYGARAVASAPTTTATISSGSPTATLAADPGLVNGDGVVIYGAGANNPLSAPSAITVTPILAKGLIGTGEVVNSLTGSTTYNYQRVMRDKLGALTAASAVGSTAVGQATLGAITVNISAITRSNNTVTVTTSSSTPLVPNAAVWITGNTDATFNGAYQVAATPSGTQFTFISGVDTRDGASTSTSGGTVTYYLGNRLTWTAGAEWQDYIYGRTGGTLTKLGATRPLENRFDDWGATLMGSPAFPSYVPTNPPVSATNDPLVTTILSGAGTTTLTLANNASNTVSGAVIKFDNAPTIKAAHDAAGSIPIYIPSTPSGTFVTNSYLNINPFPTPNTANILQAGQLTLNETMEFEGGMVWKGIAGSGTTGGLITQQAFISCLTANPCIYDNSPGGNVYVEKLALDNENDQAILWLVEGVSGFNRTYNYMSFTTGNPSTNEDYLGISFLARGGSKYQINKSGFQPHMCNSCVTGLFAPLIQMTGNDSAPSVGGPNPAGSLSLNEVYVYSKGVNMDVTVGNSTTILTVDGFYSQGPRVPMFTYSQNIGGTLADLTTIKNTVTDTGAVPLVSNLSTSLNTLYLEHIIPASSGQINITGNPIASITVNGTTGPIGPTSGVTNGPSFTSNFVNVGPQGYIGTALSAPAAPTLSAVAGSGFGPGTFYYALTAVDINGHESQLGAIASIVLSGPSTITVTPPTLPDGSIGYQPYGSNDGINFGLSSHNHIGGCTVVINSGVNFLDQDPFRCNNHGPLAPFGAQSSISTLGVSTQTFRLLNKGFSTTWDYPANLTSNQTIHIPNATGALCITASCSVNSVTIGGDSPTSSSPRSLPSIFFPGALTATWTGANWVTDRAITITRVQATLRSAPAGCSVSPVIRLTDGTSPVNLTLTASSNDSGALTQNYSAGASLSVSILTAASGCSVSPGDANVLIQYRMQ